MFAEDLASNYLALLGIQDYPVDLSQLPKALNAELVEWSIMGPASGMYRCMDGKKFVVVADDLSEFEKRRVIAHECGHAALRHRGQKLSRRLRTSADTITNKQEYQAELFAAYFLIPPWTKLPQEGDLWELSEIMHVPVDLLEFRFEHEKNQTICLL